MLIPAQARLAAWTMAVLMPMLLLAASMSAQTNDGQIVGLVTDAHGGVLPGATVTAVHADSGARVSRVANDEGRFVLPGLRPGMHTLYADLQNFRRVVRSNVVLQLGQTLALDFTLDLGRITEVVTVTAAPPLLQTTNAEVSDVVGNRAVVQLPLNGRNFLSLAQLSDAVVLPPGGTRGDALQQAGPLPNVGGQRSGHNIYLLDGVKVTDEFFNNLVINPSIDSIQEFKIQKSQYPAEFGGKASALINVATRAGTNTWLGSLFEFHRRGELDARNYFDPGTQDVPPLRQNQYGGALGGPLVRDRTFLFASYERQAGRRPLTRTFSVPSGAVRSGDFSGLTTICDPLTVVDAGPCVPFSGNRIPANRIDPIAAALLSRVPLPISDAIVQNLASVATQARNTDQFSVRGDQQLGSNDRVFARFSTFDAREAQPFGTSTLQESLLPGFGRSLETRARNLAVSHTHLFGRSSMNELRIGWLTANGGQTSENAGEMFARQVGLEGVTSDARDTGFPQVSTRGLYSTFGDPTSFVYRRNRQIELFDNLMLDRGAHRVKFGAYYFGMRFRPEQPDNARGSFTYTGQFTGNAFADFLLGYPTSASAGIGRGDENATTHWLHLYAQDDWRVRPNLTLNLGLRYEFNQHMRDLANRLSSVDYDTPGGRFVIASDDRGQINPEATALLPLLPLPYTTSADAGWDRSLLTPGNLRLAPRTGFAWSFDDARAVLRGGYGIFLNQWAYSVQTAFSRNLPFFFTRQVDVPSSARVPAFQTRDILTSDPTGVVAPTIMDHAYRVEFTQTLSGGLQYQLLPSMMAEVSYMGSWTRGADNATVHNVPEPGPGSIQARRPIPQLGAIRSIRFDGQSVYHGLTFKVDQRSRGPVSYGASYTLSSSMDDASSPGATEAETNVAQNVRNIFSDTGEWAHSSFDHRHMFAANATFQLPSASGGRGIRGVLLDGWRLTSVLSIQSGAPFTVNLGVDQANIGAGPSQRPDQSRDPNLPAARRTVEQWFDTAAFALPAPYTFGTAPRNSVRGPGFASLDLGLARTWRAGGGRNLELRWEVFNALNRTNFDLPNRTFGTSNFGRIFSAKNPREMQLGARLAF